MSQLLLCAGLVSGKLWYDELAWVCGEPFTYAVVTSRAPCRSCAEAGELCPGEMTDCSCTCS
jgi:hypothetical protein